METILTNFIQFLKVEKNYSENTCIGYKRDLDTFFSYLKQEEITINNVDYYNVRYYIVHLSSLQLSKNTIKRNLSAISSLFDYLLKQKIVASNPVVLIESIKKEKYLPEFLFIEEVQKLISATKKSKMKYRDKLIIEFLFLNGLRVSELVNVKVNDIKGNKLKVLGKGNKERYTILTTEILTTIANFIKYERTANHDYLLINNRGEQLSTRGVRYILTQTQKRSELEKNIFPHMLRHSFATYFLTHGSDLRTVQTFLGHENISTTQIYTHLSSKHLEDAYEEFNPRRKKDEK